MKKILLLLLVFISISAPAVFAQEIRIGTVAPAGSVWETTIKEIAAEWTRISNGEITVRIFTAGTVGDEADIIRKMRLGGLNAAALTPYGMKNISDDLFALSIPMLIRDDGEFDYVLNKMKPTFEKELQRKGYVSLGWTNTGWIRWFSKTRVLFPDDLRQIRLAVDSTDQKAIQVWQRSGFRVIPLSFTDLIAGIYNNMADAAILTPYAVSSMGIVQQIPFMLDMPISPVYCLFVINERTWRSINDRYKPLLIQKTSEIIDNFYPRITRIENDGIETMKQRGFTIVPLTTDARAEWERVVNSAVDTYVSQTLSPQIYAEVRRYINEYRNR